jgi:hypothetical protein
MTPAADDAIFAGIVIVLSMHGSCHAGPSRVGHTAGEALPAAGGIGKEAVAHQPAYQAWLAPFSPISVQTRHSKAAVWGRSMRQ